jgi:SsrA-binding protein
MTKKDGKNKASSSSIAQNKKARFDYFIEETFEAGLVLEGWEVKSLRAGRINLTDSYVLLKDGEAWLLGTLISPLITVSTHFVPDPVRTRKLLLNQRELSRIFSSVQVKGHTCVPLAMYWKHGRVKCEIALAKGKQKFDKRAADKDRDWSREKQRVLRIKQR